MREKKGLIRCCVVIFIHAVEPRLGKKFETNKLNFDEKRRRKRMSLTCGTERSTENPGQIREFNLKG